VNNGNRTGLNIAICGLGTVGGGTLALLQKNAEELRLRLGAELKVTRIATRTLDPEKLSGIENLSNDPLDAVNDESIDVVIETIGGVDPALEVIRQALVNGKHIVTANKALIAEYGNELFQLAQENNVTLAFESSVAGGIPIIKALREGLAANKIDWLAGIINGTGNFIMSEMTSKKRKFDEVLIEAQELGYAEADPTFDVEGIDAAHKLTIMGSIAFGISLLFLKSIFITLSASEIVSSVFFLSPKIKSKHKFFSIPSCIASDFIASAVPTTAFNIL